MSGPAHAKLSASGSEKWMTCTPSARLEEQFPDETSEFAREGTFAHAVFEQDLLNYLGRPVDPLPRDLLHFDSQDLRDHVAAAVAVAIERIEEARAHTPDAVILVEQRLDFSPWVPEGFGTGDLVIVTDDVLDVMDLKFGKGIRVDAKANSQMRLYGLGAVNELAHLYDIKTVRMTILQPRLNNYDSDELPLDDLLRWSFDHVVPRAKLAWSGKGEFVPGDHCSSCFCRARFQCQARADMNLAVAKSDFALKPPELLSLAQLANVLAKADQAIDWLNDVKTFALQQAEAGVKVPGYKLVEGRSNRKYSDGDAVAAKLIASGIDQAVIYERSLLGITAMEKAIGKKVFGDLLGDLIVKPSGKPTLVPDADKRLAISSVAAAAEDFK